MFHHTAEGQAILGFPGTLPPELITAVINAAEPGTSRHLCERQDLTLEHTTRLYEQFETTGQHPPESLVRAHLRACGASPALEEAILNLNPRSIDERVSISTYLRSLSWEQLTYMVTEATDVRAVAVLAEHGPGNNDDQLRALRYAKSLLDAAVERGELKAYTALNALSSALYELRENSAWHGEKAFCTAADRDMYVETHLNLDDVTDDELDHAVHMTYLPYLDLAGIELDHPDDWGRSTLVSCGHRMRPSALDAIAAHPNAGPLRDVIETSRAAHDQGTTLSEEGWRSSPNRDTPIAEWLRALRPHTRTSGEWAVALTFLTMSEHGTPTTSTAESTLAVLTATAA